MTDLDSARQRARLLGAGPVAATTSPPSKDPSAKDPSAKELSAKDIEQKQFVTARRGYERDEVRAYLRSIAIHVDHLERELERTVGANAMLEQQLEQAKVEIRTLQADLAEQRLRNREASGRQELCEALREHSLARALAAEAGRERAEDLLAQVIRSFRPVEREPREREDAVRPDYPPQGDRASGHTSAVRQPPQDQPRVGEAAAPRAGIEYGARSATTYILTDEQIRAIEQAAAMPGERSKAQAARILEAARRNADRITRAAHELAQLWDTLADELRDGNDEPREATVAPSIENDRNPDWQAAAERPAGTAAEPLTRAGAGAPPVRFTTNQARAAAVALHSSARDDLRLAEFWIQEAEQEAGEDATATSRIILQEALQLLTMAAELGHPAPELLEQHTELDRRTRRPTD